MKHHLQKHIYIYIKYKSVVRYKSSEYMLPPNTNKLTKETGK